MNSREKYYKRTFDQSTMEQVHE